MNKLTVEKEVELPDTETVTSFGDAVNRRQAAKEQIKQLEGMVEECDKTLGDILIQNGFSKVKWQGWTVSQRQPGERRTIDPAKLLSLGVPASVIEEATRVTITKAGISVRRSEERDDFTEWAAKVRKEEGVE